MNFRITTLFFGLLLSMLWIFGLMIAHKKAAGDQTLIIPSLSERDVKIDKVHIKRADKEAFEADLVFENGFWFLKDATSKQKARVEGFRVENIIKQIQTAKHDEATDLNRAPSEYGLDKPRVEVTLEGTTKTIGERKEWKFMVGKERNGMAHVQASGRGEKVFAVTQKSLDPLFFKDPNSLRSRRLFDFGETGVTKIKGKKEGAPSLLEIDRVDSQWTFIEPKLGPAGAESEPEEKKKDPFHKEMPTPSVTGGVKGLLNSISSVQVDDEDDFESLGRSLEKYGLEPDKEWMRIEITSKNEKNEDSKEILLVGKEVVPARAAKHRYAKLDSDDGVFQLAARRLEPIAKAIDEPGKLRSHDIASYKKDLVDAVVIQQGKNDVKFFKSEAPSRPADFMKPNVETGWQMVAAGEKKKASDSMVNALLDQVLGKKAIVEFAKGTEEEQKKEEVKWGFADPDVKIISIYINGIDKDKKEEKKDDKDKKDEKKDEKDKKDEKKDETKKDPLPELKKDQKPEVTLAIGKIEGDFMHIRRTLKDGSVSRFTVKKDFAENLFPTQGVELAYLDLALPAFALDDAVAIKLHRITDKGPDTVELARRFVEGATLWYIKDAKEPTGYKLAESSRVRMLFDQVMQRPINKKWLKKLDKDDLKNPVVTLTITVKKNIVNAKTASALIAVLAGDGSAFAALETAILGYDADPGELMTYEFGNPTEDSKDKPGVFAKHSGNPLLFLAPMDLVKALKEIDMRDRSSILYAPVGMTLATATAALDPGNTLMLASPYFTGAVHQVDPEEVTKIKLAVRTQFEFRTFEFDRKEKEKAKEPEKEKEKAKDEKAVEKGKEKEKDKAADKDKDKEKESKYTWLDKSGLQEFQVDPDKVAQLVKDFAKLNTDRFAAYTSGPRSEQKLDPPEATIRLDLTTKDGKTISLLIGAKLNDEYGYFARSSLWPEAVFFVPRSSVTPILEGARYFAKPRAVAE